MKGRGFSFSHFFLSCQSFFLSSSPSFSERDSSAPGRDAETKLWNKRITTGKKKITSKNKNWEMKKKSYIYIYIERERERDTINVIQDTKQNRNVSIAFITGAMKRSGRRPQSESSEIEIQQTKGAASAGDEFSMARRGVERKMPKRPNYRWKANKSSNTRERETERERLLLFDSFFSVIPYPCLFPADPMRSDAIRCRAGESDPVRTLFSTGR